MLCSIPAALVPYGWDDRVAALFATIDGVGRYPARVTRVERTGCFVVTEHHRTEVFARSPALPAVGDWVAVRSDQRGGDVTVAAVADRWSQLTRLDPLGAEQVLAANVDVVFVAAPCDRTSVARVEREVVFAWESGAQPVVLLTKHDLAPPGLADDVSARVIGTDVVTVSAVTGEGVDEVASLLAPARTAVLLGPSGAGKSSLANALLGRADLAVGAVRDGDHRGRHTTTSRQLLVVRSGGVLIDTPGLRSLALVGGDGSGLDAAFPDVEELAASCRFADCGHEHEPQCAVLAAIETGTLEPARLASYQKLQRELAFEERRTDRLAREAHQRVWRAHAKIGKERARKR